MKEWTTITLSGGHTVKVDKEDVERIMQHSWRVTKGTTGRARVVTSVRTKQGVKTITLGKFLMDPPDGKQVYPRRFNDGLDYRKDNLVVCTLQERQRLLPKKRKDATSEYRGVSFSRSEKKWRAAIEVNGVSMYIGSFETESAAALAYNEEARKHFGDVAYQNSVTRKKIERKGA